MLRRHRAAITARSRATAHSNDIEKRRKDRWNFLFIAGMWFQDLFNYDFRRTEQCIIPYATQEGEISFCAYNTGVGWRNIVEKMHMTATLTKWYEEKGRHEIIAGGKNVNLPSKEHSLVLNHDAVNADIQHDLDIQGIAKTAREEKIRKRNADMAKKAAEDAQHGEALSRSDSERKAGRSGFVPIDSWAESSPQPKRKRSRKSRGKSAASAISQNTEVRNTKRPPGNAGGLFAFRNLCRSLSKVVLNFGLPAMNRPTQRRALIDGVFDIQSSPSLDQQSDHGSAAC